LDFEVFVPTIILGGNSQICFYKSMLTKATAKKTVQAYRRQHYLPAVYLKQFSADGPAATRNSMIWRLDEQRHMRVTVRSQCAENNFYSSSDAKATEEMFQKFEGIYGRIAQKIWAREEPAKRDYFGLILMMFDLHCRNRCYANETGEENIHAYRVRIHCLRNQLLMGKSSENVTDAELLTHLRATWKVRLLEPTSGNELATCDNPSIWFTLDDTSDLHLIVMPITPYCCAAAFDTRYCHVTGGRLVSEDEVLLNRYQVLVCGECLFTSSELSMEEQASVRRTWKEREKPSGTVDRKQWTVNLQRLSDCNSFRFLTRVPASVEPLNEALK